MLFAGVRGGAARGRVERPEAALIIRIVLALSKHNRARKTNDVSVLGWRVVGEEVVLKMTERRGAWGGKLPQMGENFFRVRVCVEGDRRGGGGRESEEQWGKS